MILKGLCSFLGKNYHKVFGHHKYIPLNSTMHSLQVGNVYALDRSTSEEIDFLEPMYI